MFSGPATAASWNAYQGGAGGGGGFWGGLGKGLGAFSSGFGQGYQGQGQSQGGSGILQGQGGGGGGPAFGTFTAAGATAGPWGAAAGLAADVAVALLSGGGSDSGTTRERLRKTIKGEQARRAGLEAQQYEQLQKLVGQYDVARQEVGDLGRIGRQQILDQQEQAEGALTGSQIFHGTNASSLGMQARRGLSYDTGQALAGLQASLAPLYSQIAIGKGQAGYGSLANFFQQKNVGNQDIFEQKLALWENYG